MKRILKRTAAWAIGLLLIAALVFALRPAPAPADFAPVKRGPLRVTIDEEGETRVRDRFIISAPLNGRVLRIELEPGDSVKGGETALATFLPVEPELLNLRTRAGAEARIKAAEAAIGHSQARREQVRAELAFAQAQLKRYQRLAEQEIVSQEQLEAAGLEERAKEEMLEAAEFAVQNAEYELEVVKTSLLQTEQDASGPVAGAGNQAPILIRSPVDGVVLRVLRESQAVVPAGEPLVEVGDPADLEIVADLLSSDAVKIQPGNKLLIEEWGGGEPLQGRVRRVEPSGFTKISALGVEEQRVNVIIDFEDSRQAGEALGDGYRVEVRIIIWEREDVLKVPTSSLFRRGDQWAVFKVEEGRAVLQAVEIGQRNGLEAEVLSGLSSSDQVIVHPSDSISNGVEVTSRTP